MAAHAMSTSQQNGALREPQTDIPPAEASEDFDWSTVQVRMPEGHTRQFVTLYRAVQGFDDRGAQERFPGLSPAVFVQRCAKTFRATMSATMETSETNM